MGESLALRMEGFDFFGFCLNAEMGKALALPLGVSKVSQRKLGLVVSESDCQNEINCVNGCVPSFADISAIYRPRYS